MSLAEAVLVMVPVFALVEEVSGKAMFGETTALSAWAGNPRHRQTASENASL